MMPLIIRRIKRFNRSDSIEDYVRWLTDSIGVDYDESYLLRTRASIDAAVENALVDKPSWVEAAEEVVEAEPMIVPDADNPFTEQDYDSWTVRELQEECRTRGLTIRGSKAEVVLRLRRDDEGIEIVEQETEDETEAPSEEAAEAESDAPSEESEAVTEDVTDNDENNGETQHTDEEE
tara:strand:+ start:368 stop:901 length:534 start_codon:yes stop_codon:yes gene_type:complete